MSEPPIIRRNEKYAFRLTKESSPLALHQRQGEDYKANASHHSLCLPTLQSTRIVVSLSQYR